MKILKIALCQTQTEGCFKQKARRFQKLVRNHESLGFACEEVIGNLLNSDPGTEDAAEDSKTGGFICHLPLWLIPALKLR